MKRYLMVAALALVLAGCGSNVKLDPPIEGSPTTGVGAGGDGAGGALGQGAGQSTVTQVQAGGAGADAQGPVGVGRVIYFDYDSFTVKPDYQGVVDQHARFLQANRPKMKGDVVYFQVHGAVHFAQLLCLVHRTNNWPHSSH